VKNTEAWAKISPYNRYYDFIAPDADRYTVLLEHIEKLKLNSAVITVSGNRHIFIFPPDQKSLRSKSGFPFRGQNPYLLCAHYDRVTDSPGANDNSIAVFHLLNAAIKLSVRGISKWIIVFTDKEELKKGESFEDQGSFSLAREMKMWGLEKARIYNFDTCGAGNAFLISTTTDHILENSERPNIKKVSKKIKQLRDHALATTDILRTEKVLLAPAPFSDDAGFLFAGLASQTVTILPGSEAEKYEALLRVRPEFIDLIISGKAGEPDNRKYLPETWLNLNNAGDTPSRLTPQYFDQIVRFMVELCR